MSKTTYILCNNKHTQVCRGLIELPLTILVAKAGTTILLLSNWSIIFYIFSIFFASSWLFWFFMINSIKNLSETRGKIKSLIKYYELRLEVGFWPTFQHLILFMQPINYFCIINNGIGENLHTKHHLRCGGKVRICLLCMRLCLHLTGL